MLTFQGSRYPQSLEETISARNTALIVYDMQAGITGQIKNGAEITARVRLILDAARKARLPAFFTRHMSLPKNLLGSFQCRTAMAWQRVDSPEKINPMFLRDSPAFQIVPELSPLPSEAVVDKITMSAFEGHFCRSLCAITAFAASLLSGSPWKSESIPHVGREPTLDSGRFWCATPAVSETRRQPIIRSRRSSTWETRP